ncbi:antibiotic ABC transporter substrate-binding protein [Loktanella sp. S4079]|nr:antibiotic ABC transporter substrate-binding protein [Loktanella sp. S4079]
MSLLPRSTWAQSSWPRNMTNADGSTTQIPSQPQRILSTSVTLSGSLLAIDAPLIASATTVRGDYFGQWQDIATDRGVEKLWRAGAVDLESVWAFAPDLIVVSASGADSALAQRAALSQVAPVIVLDYGAVGWQELALQLGHATGQEAHAQALLDEFATTLDTTRAQLNLPQGLTNIISYNGPGAPNPIATAHGVHGRLLSALGFTLEDPPRSWQSANIPPAADFIRAAYEHLTELTALTTFVLAGTDEDAQRLMNDPILSNLPSVKNGQVYGLGRNSFRVDYYSASEIVAGIAERFGRS